MNTIFKLCALALFFGFSSCTDFSISDESILETSNRSISLEVSIMTEAGTQVVNASDVHITPQNSNTINVITDYSGENPQSYSGSQVVVKAGALDVEIFNGTYHYIYTNKYQVTINPNSSANLTGTIQGGNINVTASTIIIEEPQDL